MSYVVFARKFRPQRFEDLIGQEPIVTTLRHAIEQQRIGQAYLFAGPRGTGKTSTARIFAKALNCEKGPTPTPCNTCQTCLEITEGRSLDVIEIDGASNALIEHIRALRENVKFSPVRGPFKVYIIDEFHQIKGDAASALLKTLEEPPAHVKFIFATTAPHKVLPTILSRCQRYEFKRLPRTLILNKLKEIVKAEKLTVPAEALDAVARAAAGSLRDAESLLDQLVAFGQGTVRMEDVHALLGIVEDEMAAQAVDAIVQRQPLALVRLVAQLADAGRDLTQFLTGVIGYLRNLMVAKLGAEGQEVLDVTPEAFQRLSAQAGQFSDEEMTYLFYLLAGTYEVMRRVGDARTPLEVALIRAGRREPVAQIGQLIRQLEALPRTAPSPTPAPTPAASRPVPRPVEVDVPNEAPEEVPGAATLEQVTAAWPQILAIVQQRKMSTASYLLEAQPVGIVAGHVTIGFPTEFRFHKEVLERPEHRGLIEEAIQQALGVNARAAFEVVEGLAVTRPAVVGEERPDAPPAARAPADEPPIVKSAAELFGGRLTPPRR